MGLRRGDGRCARCAVDSALTAAVSEFRLHAGERSPAYSVREGTGASPRVRAPARAS